VVRMHSPTFWPERRFFEESEPLWACPLSFCSNSFEFYWFRLTFSLKNTSFNRYPSYQSFERSGWSAEAGFPSLAKIYGKQRRQDGGISIGEEFEVITIRLWFGRKIFFWFMLSIWIFIWLIVGRLLILVIHVENWQQDFDWCWE
jgi:hypothetical protein